MLPKTMKKVVIIAGALILLLLKSSYGQYIRAVYNNERILGNVATVTDINYVMKDTAIVDSVTYTTKYDNEGWATDIYEHFPKTYRIDTTSFSHIYTRYEYDNNGKRKSMKCVNDVVNYNEKGQEVKRTKYNKSGILTEEITSSYDDNGNRIESKIQRYRSRGFDIVRYKYDVDKKLIEEIYEFPGTRFKLRYQYITFDVKHNWTKRISIDEKGRKSLFGRRITYAD